ncbi:MAG: AraC family transcriptional regulator [Kofleriaceae bacterium]
MLYAASQTHFAGGALASALLLDRQLRIHVVDKRGLTFDSRFAPPSPVTRAIVNVYLLLDGAMQVDGGPAVTAPALWILDETELERPTPAARRFRVTGLTIDLRVPRHVVRGPIGVALPPRPLPSALAASAAALAALAGQPGAGAASIEPVLGFLAALAEAGVVDGEVPIRRVEDPGLTRLWQAVTPAYDAYATAVTIDQVAAASGRSSRQVRRELKALACEFDLFGGNFRHITRITRLRAAVLLLSAPTATVAEVADRVGYGSAVAMARAFRDADMPTPSDVRGHLRAGA